PGNGLSGRMYPIAAVLVSEQCAGWLTEDGFAHISTFGGAELGCVAALKTLEICSRPETRSMVHYISALTGAGLRGIQADYPDWFTGIRQNGVVMGLEFNHPEGAKYVMRHLYRTGVWAIFSTLDPRVLQYKPGLLMTPELSEELLERTGDAVGRGGARADPVHQPGVQRVLQGHPVPADPQRDRGQPAPDGEGMLRRRGPDAGRRGHRGGRPGRRDQPGRGRHRAAHRGAHGRP